MLVLSIDTCGSSGSIALGRIDTERAEVDRVSILGETELAGKTYSAQLVPAIRTLLESHSLIADALHAIVIVNGPGSFTGIRVGVSSAKGFAEALSIPLVTVSRLAVLAWKAHCERAALDAGRNELYVLNDAHESSYESLISAANLANPAGTAVCEPSVHWRFPDATLTTPPTAADALRFAAPRLLARDFADILTLDGNYLRRSDAEIFSKVGAPGLAPEAWDKKAPGKP